MKSFWCLFLILGMYHWGTSVFFYCLKKNVIPSSQATRSGRGVEVPAHFYRASLCVPFFFYSSYFLCSCLLPSTLYNRLSPSWAFYISCSRDKIYFLLPDKMPYSGIIIAGKESIRSWSIVHASQDSWLMGRYGAYGQPGRVSSCMGGGHGAWIGRQISTKFACIPYRISQKFFLFLAKIGIIVTDV